MDSPSLAEANVIGVFSKLLSPVKNPNTLRLLKNILDGHIETVSSDDTDSFRTIESPTKPLYIDSPMKVHDKPRTVVTNVGTLLQVSSNFDEEVEHCPQDKSVTPTHKPVSDFVELIPSVPTIDEDVIMGIWKDIQTLQVQQPNYSRSHKVSYIWVNSQNRPYVFGNVSHSPNHFSMCPSIKALMDTINEHLDNAGNDACLITMYDSGKVSLPLHSDDEDDTIDHNHSISVFSMGDTRTIQFCSKVNKEPLKSFELHDKSLLIMKPGCQQHLKHEVCSSDNAGARISLSFRKLTPVPDIKSTPLSSPGPPPLDYMSEGYYSPTTPGPTHMTSYFPKHLVIGDSLIRNINLENCITLCKGGAIPRDILPLLKSNQTCLPPMSYTNIESITLSCGTNLIHKLAIPLADIFLEYDDLVGDLRALFPNAIISLFNIPPRPYSNYNVVRRINIFNNFLFDLCNNTYSGLCVLRLYWPFIKPDGFQHEKLYKHDFLHFSKAGVKILENYISELHRYECDT